MLPYAAVGQLLSHFAQGLYCLVPDYCFLHLGQLLKWLQQRVPERWASHVGHKLAQLLSHGQQNLILIVVVFNEERQQLAPRPLLAQRQSNRAQALDRVQTT
eukprot:GHRQ01021172.1.p2 GENE.GHRQ01021172.1~~GHRQ01021172.1.p2  ORF type:complete len:102 (+),score=11.70 GHRQ01021172.1:130-435(+)